MTGDGGPGGSSFPRTRARTHGVSRISLTAGRQTTNPHDGAAASPPETGDGAGTLFSQAERVSPSSSSWALSCRRELGVSRTMLARLARDGTLPAQQLPNGRLDSSAACSSGVQFRVDVLGALGRGSVCRRERAVQVRQTVHLASRELGDYIDDQADDGALLGTGHRRRFGGWTHLGRARDCRGYGRRHLRPLASNTVTSVVGVAAYAVLSLGAPGAVAPDWPLGVARAWTTSTSSPEAMSRDAK